MPPVLPAESSTKPARFACLAPAALPLSPAALPACRESLPPAVLPLLAALPPAVFLPLCLPCLPCLPFSWPAVPAALPTVYPLPL
jgi:hypothetical protein